MNVRQPSVGVLLTSCAVGFTLWILGRFLGVPSEAWLILAAALVVVGIVAAWFARRRPSPCWSFSIGPVPSSARAMRVVNDVLTVHRVAITETTATRVFGRSRATGLSFGSDVTALIDEANGDHRLTVSTSRDPAVLLDYGSSRRLLRKLESEIRAGLGAPVEMGT